MTPEVSTVTPIHLHSIDKAKNLDILLIWVDFFVHYCQLSQSFTQLPVEDFGKF